MFRYVSSSSDVGSSKSNVLTLRITEQQSSISVSTACESRENISILAWVICSSASLVRWPSSRWTLQHRLPGEMKIPFFTNTNLRCSSEINRHERFSVSLQTTQVLSEKKRFWQSHRTLIGTHLCDVEVRFRGISTHRVVSSVRTLRASSTYNWNEFYINSNQIVSSFILTSSFSELIRSITWSKSPLTFLNQLSNLHRQRRQLASPGSTFFRQRIEMKSRKRSVEHRNELLPSIALSHPAQMSRGFRGIPLARRKLKILPWKSIEFDHYL